MSEIIIFIKRNVLDYWIDSQSKKFIHLKYLILETAYTFSLYSVDILVLYTLNTLQLVFSGIKTATFPFFIKGYRENVVIFFYLFLKL